MLQGLEIVPVKIGPGKFACPFCPLTKPKFLEMESHIRYEHTNAKRYNRSREKKSGVWNYFESLESDPKFAMCKVCQKTLSLGSDNPRKQTLTNSKTWTLRGLAGRREDYSFAERTPTASHA